MFLAVSSASRNTQIGEFSLYFFTLNFSGTLGGKKEDKCSFFSYFCHDTMLRIIVTFYILLDEHSHRKFCNFYFPHQKIPLMNHTASFSLCSEKLSSVSHFSQIQVLWHKWDISSKKDCLIRCNRNRRAIQRITERLPRANRIVTEREAQIK